MSDTILDDDNDAGPAPEPDLSDARFVLLHHLNSPVEADMVNDLLRRNEIRSVVQSSAMDAMSALLSSGVGAQVLVDERDYDRAAELYAAYFGADAQPLTGTTVADDADAAADSTEDTE
jgi:Putative prokaryotic signal transducing protein